MIDPQLGLEAAYRHGMSRLENIATRQVRFRKRDLLFAAFLVGALILGAATVANTFG
jgi:hypothetical protein